MAGTEKTIFLNSVIGILNRIVILVMGMVFRKVFILYLGESVSGLSSLYSNILNFLSIATAGLGATAIHRIYICNANDNQNEIIKIETFSKIFFRYVTCFILVFGMAVSFFIDKMILNNEYSLFFLRTVFFMQVLSECINYWFSSKRIFLQALEKLYTISLVEMFTNIVIYVIQIVLLIKTQNYYLYLLTLIFKYGIIGYCIHRMAIHKFPWIKYKCSIKLSEMSYLFADLKNTIFLQISTFIFISTDSLVVSNYLGLIQVNLYDNYLIIVNAVVSAVDEVNAALRATFGNILAKDSSKESKLGFLYSTTFVQFMIASFCVVCLKCLVDDFITIWLDKKYVLPSITSNIIILNLYCSFLSSPLKNYMLMCGKFSVDKKITFSSAILNIVLSIILVKEVGLAGVILGTLVANIVIWVERGAYFLKEFDRKTTMIYSIELLKYVLVTSISVLVATSVTSYCGSVIHNIYVLLVIKAVVCLVVPNLIACCLFRKRDEVKKMIVLCKRRIGYGR